MKRLLLFEHLKLWRTPKTPLVLLAVVVALVGMVWYNSEQDKQYWSRQLQELRFEKSLIINEIKHFESLMETTELLHPENTPLDDEQLVGEYWLYRRQYLYNYQQEIISRKLSKGEAEPSDWVKLAIERDQHLLKGLEAGHSFLDATIAEVRQRLLVNQYLDEQGIAPQHSPYEMTATNFIYQLFNYPWILIILLAIAMLTVDIFSGEAEGGSYKVLYSQPYGRGTVCAGKYLVRFVNSFIIVTGIVVVFFAIIAVFNLGDVNYPILFYSDSYHGLMVTGDHAADSYSFLPWWQYILNLLPLYLVLCCFMLALVGMASLLLNNTANVLSMLFCLLFLDFLSRTLFAPESMYNIFWPLTAAELNPVLQGTFPMSAAGYVILLGIMTVLLLAGSLIVLKKRDLTGGMGA